MIKLIESMALNVQKYFLSFDNRLLRPVKGETYEPIFILGSPRSGSTLIYQVCIANLEIFYLSNLMTLMPAHLLAVAKLTKGFVNRRAEIQQSHLGFVKGLNAPSEAGALFRFWFEQEEEEEHLKAVRLSLLNLSSYMERPLMAKNLFNVYRTKELSSAFPKARYIFLTRDSLYTAQSLLQSRVKQHGDKNKWLSIQPPGFDMTLEKPPLYQVMWQTLKIERSLEDFKRTLKPKQQVTIQYEDFCQNPEKTLNLISSVFEVPRKQTSSPVDPFPISDKVDLSAEDWSELKKYYKEIKQELR